MWWWLVDENVGVRAVRELADCAGTVPRVVNRVFGAGELVVLDESIDESLRGCDVVKARIEFVIVGGRDAAASAAGEETTAAVQRSDSKVSDIVFAFFSRSAPNPATLDFNLYEAL